MEPTTEPIPQSLLYEEFGGRKYYRRGYREVMLGLKDESEILVDPRDYRNELDSGSEVAYMLEKSERLLTFGVEGVAWVLSKSRKILLALPSQRPQLFD